MYKLGLQLWVFMACMAVTAAYAQTFVYQEEDGTRWITDRPLDPERFTFIDKYGRPTATLSCRGVTPKILKQRADRYLASIEQYAETHQLDARLVQAIIMVESCFDSRAVSRAGAHGLMQLMPATARSYGVLDSFNPDQNLRAGIHHFKDLMVHFKNNLKLSLAAYNAGTRNVEKYRGIPPFEETRGYVEKVLNYYGRYRREAGLPTVSIQ
jgi:soluble lytic murein transglycosylase-like protein